MHILGTAKSNQFLVLMSLDELAQVQGLYSHYADGFKADVGTTVPISEIYKDADQILILHKEAGEAAKKLRAAGDKFASYFERMEAKKKV